MNEHTNINPNILVLAQTGKQEAQADIYEAYYLRIYRFIFYRVSHKETAEDITEEVFIKAFNSLKKLEKLEAFEGWLFQIARNMVIDYYRKKSN